MMASVTSPVASIGWVSLMKPRCLITPSRFYQPRMVISSAANMHRCKNGEWGGFDMSSTGTTGISETFTIEKLQEVLKLVSDYGRPKRNNLFDLGDLLSPGPSFMGMRIIETPMLEPKQKIKVRDIKFSDGTSILSPEFLAEQNKWWAEQFGYREDIGYVFGGNIFMSPRSVVAIRNVG
jgi:hypothetical protein